MSTAIGAKCVLVFNDEPETKLERYISFGQYNDVDDTDEYGVPDVDVFYYCFASEAQLVSLMGAGVEEFTVLSYELKKRFNDSSPSRHNCSEA